jgi:hypothetical protein
MVFFTVELCLSFGVSTSLILYLLEFVTSLRFASLRSFSNGSGTRCAAV